VAQAFRYHARMVKIALGEGGMRALGKSLACISWCSVLAWSAGASAAEWRGLLDVRAVEADAARSWTDAGLGKLRYDGASNRLGIGQAVLRGDADLTDTLSASAVLSADTQHHGRIDVREAWLGWSPLPVNAWKLRMKAGFFFAPSSVEIDYAGVAWTPERTISSSAINSWIGEELRTNGAEMQLTHVGRYSGASYDLGLTLGTFFGNDPAGTLLAWRGWTISDRIAGRHEAVLLADLPVYRADGAIPRQDRRIRPFREIDGRPGYYIGGNFKQGERVELAIQRYDNRADPLVVKDGQYGWRTRYSHASLVLRPGGGWELLAQAMHGDTLMGKNAVALDFRAWYVLASHPVGPGRLALRYDRFGASEHDVLPSDPNNEKGRSLALAYTWPLDAGVTLAMELLAVDSQRAARSMIGLRPGQVERSVTSSVRWQF
jgi:hypothetical protein